MKKKLWQTDAELHPVIEAFTVDGDHLLDQQLIPYDIKASLAHAKMLGLKKILSEIEYEEAVIGLNEILELWKKGKFHIKQNQEDGHTAIEQYLTEHHGDVGRKIHTGRSRNDQALTMLRLFMKDKLIVMEEKIYRLEKTLEKQAKKCKDVPMPGYTHAQKAMPTTTSMWLRSFSDALRDQYPFLTALQKIIDQSPLGSASGFGVANFDALRKVTAEHVGLARVQENPMYCGMSRGNFENQFLQTISPTMLILSRLVNDMLLFTMREFDFMSLPNSFTTGSSIMPQKRNYDVLEVMRGRINNFLSTQTELQVLCQNLISGYNRDIQLSKKIFLEQIKNVEEILEVATLIVSKLNLNEEKLRNAMSDDLYATEQIYDLVNSGEPFRSAYLKVKTDYQSQ